MKAKPRRLEKTQREGLRLEPDSKAVLDSLGCAVLLADNNGTIRCWNSQAEKLLPKGDDAESVLGVIRVLGPFEGWVSELARVHREGKPARFAGALQLVAGTLPKLVTIRCFPLNSESDALSRGVVLRIDEEENQLDIVENKLEVSKRLTSLGKLAARVAHELNNPLDGILRYINLAMRQLEEPAESPVRTYLTESRSGLLRMVQIIGDVLTHTRGPAGDLEEASVNEVVEESLRVLADRFERQRIVVAVDFQSPHVPRVRGSRYYQVCCNLLRNAADAMPNGGRLEITTGIVDGAVVMRVADTGTGLPRPVEKLFEPFYTTKPLGKGTGLGLAICKDYVEEMGGVITANDREEGGAVFTVRIPFPNFAVSRPRKSE